MNGARFMTRAVVFCAMFALLSFTLGRGQLIECITFAAFVSWAFDGLWGWGSQ